MRLKYLANSAYLTERPLITQGPFCFIKRVTFVSQLNDPESVDVSNARQRKQGVDLGCLKTPQIASLALNTCTPVPLDKYQLNTDLLGTRYGERKSY